MKIYHVLLLIGCTINGFAQKPAKPDAYAKEIKAADLRKHLFIIAGPQMEGRETATPGQRKAAAYIESQFRAIGLEPGNKGSYQMNFPVYQDSLLSATIEVAGQSFELDKDFNPVIAGNIDGTIYFSEAVFIGLNAPADSVRNMNLTGRLVLFEGSAPQGRNAGSPLYNILVNKGAGAILFIQNSYPKNTSARKGNANVNLYRRNITPQQYSVSNKIAQAITGQANGTTLPPIMTYNTRVMLQTRKTSINIESSNVIGVVPGTDLKDQYLFITAHYDHLGKRGDSVIYYGADDDGSGTAGVIEIADAFMKAKASGKGPRRTVVFMTVSGEEKGLWGSAYYSSYPVFPLENTTADLNIDMIGRSDTARRGDTTNYIYIVGDDKLSSDLRTISEAVNKKHTKLELDYKFNDPKDPNRIYFRSDHYNFAKKGVPIIFYYDGMLKGDYHKPTDTPDKINYPLLAKRAQLVFYTAWEMANRNDMLKRDIPLDASAMTR